MNTGIVDLYTWICEQLNSSKAKSIIKPDIIVSFKSSSKVRIMYLKSVRSKEKVSLDLRGGLFYIWNELAPFCLQFGAKFSLSFVCLVPGHVVIKQSIILYLFNFCCIQYSNQTRFILLFIILLLFFCFVIFLCMIY
jgi:hypothetical protein